MHGRRDGRERRARAEVLSLNVLPVILDLSPPIKNNSAGTGGGTSALDGFARLLDQAVSGAGPGRGISTPAYTPSLRPTWQSEESRQPTVRDQVSNSHTETVPPRRQSSSPVQSDSAAQSHRSQSERPPANEAAARRKADSSSQGRKPTAKEAGSSAQRKSEGTNKTTSNSSRKKAAEPADKTGAASAGKTAAHGKKKSVDHQTRTGALTDALMLALSEKHGVASVRAGATKGTKVVGGGPASKGGESAVGAKATLADGKNRAAVMSSAVGGQQDGKTAASSQSAAADEKAQKPTTAAEADGKKQHPTVKKTGKIVMPVSVANTLFALQLPSALTHSTTGGLGGQNPVLVNAATAQTTAHQDSGGSGAAAQMQHGAKNQPGSVTIVDLRNPAQSKGSTTTSQQGQGQQSGNVRLFQLVDGGSNATVRSGGESAVARPGGAPVPSQSFSSLTDQIVKQTGILLKSNNSGEIRLVLKPENLGNLRIKIDMNNNNLTGRILVQNHEALRLIQQNLDSLYRALRDSGFTATALNVSVGGRDSGEKERGRSTPLPMTRALAGVRGFDGQAPLIETAGSNYTLVNLVI